VPALSGSVALSCTGAPANSICTVNPSTENLGGTYTISATVQTGQTQARNLAPRSPFNPRDSPVFLALFTLPLACFARRRRVARLLLPIVTLAALTGLAGCGASREIPGGGGGGGTGGGGSSTTPAGTYNLTVSASAAGLTHSVTLTLVVQ
jgi:uncharacterized membrane protein YgcG